MPDDDVPEKPSEEPTPTQKTKPAKGNPIEIPVPKRTDVMGFLEKAAKLPAPERAEPTTSSEN